MSTAEVHHMPSVNVVSMSPTAKSTQLLSKAPPVEIKLFVGRVPRTYTEDMLRPIFEDVGSVGDVVIIKDRATGAHKGCAFVRMASITKADQAIRQLNNIRVLDESLGPLQVKYAAKELERLGLSPESTGPGFDQAKLFVGSLSKDATEESIREVFGKYGTLDEIYLMKDDQKRSKGCAFVKFAFKEEALHAIANLNGKFTMPGSQRAMEVRFAVAKKFTAPEVNGMSTSDAWEEYFTPDGRPYYHNFITRTTQWEKPYDFESPRVIQQKVSPGVIGAQTHGPPGANVFIFHIPNEWTEQDLISHFSPFGQIYSVRIATDKSTGRNRGFGFVSYSNVQSSIDAVSALNGYGVSGKRLKVQIKKGEECYAKDDAAYLESMRRFPTLGNLQPAVHLAAMQHGMPHNTNTHTSSYPTFPTEYGMSSQQTASAR